MSSLIFMSNADTALVATDTLAVSSGGKPVTFTTKAFYVPHLRMVMAGTGLAGFLARWLLVVNGGLIIPGVESLNAHTTAHLLRIWDMFKKEYPDYGGTATVYHFGFSEFDDLMTVYAYRSESGFIGERIPYGTCVKPECTVKDNVSFPDDLLEMMNEQRTIQRCKPETERVYIGGEILVYHLVREGCSIYPQAYFEDAAEDTKTIYSRFDENGRHS